MIDLGHEGEQVEPVLQNGVSAGDAEKVGQGQTLYISFRQIGEKSEDLFALHFVSRYLCTWTPLSLAKGGDIGNSGNRI